MNASDMPGRSIARHTRFVFHTHRERLAWSREVDRVSLERVALAEALGEPDTTAINQLHAHGLRASTVDLAEWIPAVEVAWTDGTDEAERHALRTQLSADDLASEAGVDLVDRWLTQRPSAGFFRAARQALRNRLQGLDEDERNATLARIVAKSEAIGRAAGGTFGVGSLSPSERRQIDRIRRELEQFN
jgi:hypothetical protein